MATTRPKESSSLGKERRISAPTSVSLSNTPTKRTPKASPRGLSPSSPPPPISSEKHLPNYLKSTASSRHEPGFKPVKKLAPVPESRPSLNRRRSFDRPPSTAPRLEKPFSSPGPRDRPTHVPIRSSSFGAKPTTVVSSIKPSLLERSASKISKVRESQQPVQNLRSSHTVKKSLKKEPEMAPRNKNVIEHVDQCCLVTGDDMEEIKKIECELDADLPDPMPEFEKEIRTDLQEIKIDISRKEAAEIKNEVEKKLNHYHFDEVVEETPPAADTKTGIPAKSSSEENRQPNEGAGEEAKTEENAERMTEEKEVVVVVSDEVGNNKNAENDDDQGGQQDGQSCTEENDNDSKNAEMTAKEVEAAATAGKQRQGGGPGRKESPAVYNDVIEETASKLLETRKNKVKALAGAFQTVIDYESSSK